MLTEECLFAYYVLCIDYGFNDSICVVISACVILIHYDSSFVCSCSFVYRNSGSVYGLIVHTDDDSN